MIVMKKFEITNKATRAFHMGVLKFKKHSPEILVVAGVIGGVVSAVMACKATTKLEGILEKTKEDIDAIHEFAANPALPEGETYTEEDSKKDLTIVYAKSALEVGKLYAPSVILGGLSIAAILASNNIMRKRNVAIAAAYTAIDKQFKEYSGRLIDRFGKDLDRELRFNIKSKEIEEVTVNEDGSESTVKKTINYIDNTAPTTYSGYSRFFDDGCTGWDPDPSFSLMFLKRQEDYATDKLKSRGYLFLNEVYELLGIPVCPMGQTIGWIYDKDHPIGDNYVDFGIFNSSNEKCRDFVNGYENVILLDFNVDGDILSYI
jgi:hypothetical protein